MNNLITLQIYPIKTAYCWQNERLAGLDEYRDKNLLHIVDFISNFVERKEL